MQQVLLIMLLCFGFVVPTFSPPALLVTSTIDAPDALPGDGLCTTANQQCTLRAAIQEANARPGPDTITLPVGMYRLSLTGTDNDASAGDLDITDPLTITGQLSSTTIIDAQAIDRVFSIWNTRVTLSNLTIQGGKTSNQAPLTETNGGGILNAGVLTLRDTRVQDNHAGDFGGGIANNAQLTITYSRIEHNTAVSGAGLGNATNSTAAITGTLLQDNTASADGGGISAVGHLLLTNSTVRQNHAAVGGGISTGAQTIITTSTIAANSAEGTTAGYGGGIVNAGILQIKTSTLSGNQARIGGGLAQGECEMCSTQLEASTITVNQALSGGGVWITSGQATLLRTIVAENASGDCTGTMTSQDYNLIGMLSGCTLTGEITHTVIGRHPLLGPLQDNGGTTWTHAPQLGSPAIDAGGACQDSDQRGHSRPVGRACDIGAVEADTLRLVYLPLLAR